MKKKLFLIIFCDTDPIYSPNQDTLFQQDSVWDTTISCIQRLKERIEKFKDCNGQPVRVSWLLRSDVQTYQIWDDWCYPARKYQHFWNECLKRGDEIGWHPHLWRLDKTRQKWFQEIHDPVWITQCLQSGYRELSYLFQIESTRTGWCFHNTSTMNLFSDLGIKYDFSALPGMWSDQKDDNIYDWEGVMTQCYHPSRTNYKVEDSDIRENLPILEIPMTVYPQPRYMQILSGHKIAFINIAKHPLFFHHALQSIRNQKENKLFLTYFHPNDIQETKGMFSMFSLNNMIHNLHHILETAKKYFEIECITPSSLANYLPTAQRDE